MTELRVTTDFLEKLAALQDGTKADFKKSAGAVAGIGTSVWVNHGLACGPGNAAVQQIEALHTRVLQLMESVATDLAESLRIAVDAYSGTDQQAADSMRKQVLSD